MRFYVYVPGILTWPGKSDNWHGRATTWTNKFSEHKAERIDYFVTPLLRAFGQKKRVKKLSKTLHILCNATSKDDVVLVGHSNGCDVILKAARYLELRNIYEIHLFSAATKRDCEANGLNEVVKDSPQCKVYLYIGGNDMALGAARFGRWLGYGTLGLDGPVNAKTKIHVECREDFGHSDWWHDSQWDYWIRRVVKGNERKIVSSSI